MVGPSFHFLPIGRWPFWGRCQSRGRGRSRSIKDRKLKGGGYGRRLWMIDEIISAALILLAVLGWLSAGFLMIFRRYWIWDYKIDKHGVVFLLFRFFPIWRISRRRIREAYVISTKEIRSLGKFFLFWPHFAAGNRWTRTVLFLRTRGLWRRWVLTPPDPWQAADFLESPRQEPPL